MLSLPVSYLMFFATISSNRTYSVFPNDTLSSKFFLTQSAMFYEDLHYHTPSQHITIKNKSFLDIFTISGIDVMACSSRLTSFVALNYKSPKALVRFKHPFTLPFYTYPPALVMRSIS